MDEPVSPVRGSVTEKVTTSPIPCLRELGPNRGRLPKLAAGKLVFTADRRVFEHIYCKYTTTSGEAPEARPRSVKKEKAMKHNKIASREPQESLKIASR